jgi:hypothetical protein
MEMLAGRRLCGSARRVLSGTLAIWQPMQCRKPDNEVTIAVRRGRMV